MPPADFSLGPAPVTVDGLLTVPIDVAIVSAVVTLDASASSAAADVTMTYAVGPTAGHPLFDLRQTIGQAWLDGVPISPTLLASHDVGAGAFSSVRVLESFQAAGSVHTLRLVYALGTPQAQLGGAYPPVLQWSPGPRVRWTWGMSDLNAGRYLEAWLPSNLIFDQFPVDLEIVLTGTMAAHSVITNAAVTVLGANRWRLDFPPRFAPLGHLLELRASDTVEQASATVALPLAGTITVEAWKLAGGAADLSAQISAVQAMLTANENAYGRFLGNRFVMFFHGAGGGMEYCGATTTATGALEHEAFHSWFARGISPASQADAWWDEGFTTFHDDGADDAQPFDFLETAVTLCSREPFQRRTASNAYADGSRFFRGVAATIGIAPLRAAMRALYEEHRGNPVSTAMIEEHLVARSGAASLVDAFHRFVYGYADPSPSPRLWIGDAPGHTGTDAWPGAFWDSPDLWVRNADDGGTTHQPPEYGQDNWLYARVHNDAAGGTCRHFVVTFGVKEFAGTEFVYPGDFLPCVTARAAFDLAPGATRIVSARWPRDRVPPVGTHPCIVASVQARGDHPSASLHVWEHANLAQKNLTVVDMMPGEFAILPVVLGNLAGAARGVLEILRESQGAQVDVALVHRSKTFFGGRPRPIVVGPVRPDEGSHELMDCGGAHRREDGRVGGLLTSREPERIARRFAGGYEQRVKPGARVRVPVRLAPDATTVVGLKVAAPPDAEPGTSFVTHLVQRAAGGRKVVGGVAIEVRVSPRERDDC